MMHEESVSVFVVAVVSFVVSVILIFCSDIVTRHCGFMISSQHNSSIAAFGCVDILEHMQSDTVAVWQHIVRIVGRGITTTRAKKYKQTHFYNNN